MTSTRRRHGAHLLASFLSLASACAAAPPAWAQITEASATGEVLAGQSGASASTTVVFLGDVLPEEPTTFLTTRVGFNVNADSTPGLVALQVALLSFDVRFRVQHAASFDLTFDFLLRGQLLRVADEECQGSILLGDVSIPTLVRLSDGAEFPLGATLAGASLSLDANTTGITLAGQDDRTVSFRDQVVEATDYQLSFTVSATAISQSCEVSARFGADNGGTLGCDACVYPGFGERVRDDDGLFITLTVNTLCGDVRLDPGEECDFGPLNGAAESCCDAFCRLAPASQVCRPAAGECDQSETCNGQSAGCPTDLPKPAGSPCTPDRSSCTDDACDTGGACAHPLLAGATCDAETCTCDHDGLFCTGPLRCAAGGGLCTVLPTPCAEDDTCDEEGNVCVSPFGTVTASPTSSPTATGTSPGGSTPTATLTATAGSATPNSATATSTPPASVTALPPGSPTSTPTVTVTTAAPSSPTSTATATAAAVCAGDCNGNGTVAINELVLGVNIALGNQSTAACAALDTNRDDRIAINELIAGVSSTLFGCRT